MSALLVVWQACPAICTNRAEQHADFAKHPMHDEVAIQHAPSPAVANVHGS